MLLRVLHCYSAQKFQLTGCTFVPTVTVLVEELVMVDVEVATVATGVTAIVDV